MLEIPLGPVVEIVGVNMLPDPVTVDLLLDEGPDAPMDEVDAEPVLVGKVTLEETPVPLVLEETVTPDGPRVDEDEMGLPVALDELVVGIRFDVELTTLVPELVVPVTDDGIVVVVPEEPDTDSELVVPVTDDALVVVVPEVPDTGSELVGITTPEVKLPTIEVTLPTTELRGLEFEVVVAPVAEVVAVESMEEATPVPEVDRPELIAVPVTDSPVLAVVAAVSVFEVV